MENSIDQISTLYNMANCIVRKQLKHADELKSCSNTNEKDKNHTTKNVLEVKREKIEYLMWDV